MSIAGVIILTTGTISASFATSTTHLILTQGVLYGLGGAMVYNPFIFYLDEWFIKRKGLAYGIFWAGTGVGSSVLPFLMEWSLLTYGFRTTLRAWGILTVSIYPVRHPYKVTSIITKWKRESKTSYS